MPLWKQDRYSQIAATLPVMLRDADALVEADLSARHVRGRLLHLVGWLMTQTRAARVVRKGTFGRLKSPQP
ncbi:hypothetical protein ACQPZZ_29005 [Microbispora sp. CA-135349]|uniref:hypothetical protein n=1 Tax=Microbispora sp. CA-135349 TaxID=3239953 RepID=UPI003D8BFE51